LFHNAALSYDRRPLEVGYSYVLYRRIETGDAGEDEP
jgi:hypothetical protein